MVDDGDGLDELLGGSRAPGVYRWHALSGPSEVRDRVEAAGWRFAHLGGWTATDRPAVLRAVGRALDLPAHYGQNLDALVDCLRDLDGPTLLVWEHWARFARRHEAGFRATVGVLAARARKEEDPGAPSFAVLLWGEGPPSDTASLD